MNDEELNNEIENEEVLEEDTSAENSETPKKSNSLPIIIVVIALLVLGGVFLSKNKSQVNTTKEITLEEISKHSTREDCWITIEGGVYDVTKFVPNHPGKDAILFGCGKDATPMFNKRKDGTAHSDRARVQLSKLQIGVLSN